MNYITALIENFINIPVDKFTDKLISAFQVAEVGRFTDDVKARLLFIESNTHEDINVSIYMLDRQINPETTGFKSKSNSALFTQNLDKVEGARPQIRIPEEQIQKYLCLATREVAQIVMANTEGYNLEWKMPKQKDSEKSIIEF